MITSIFTIISALLPVVVNALEGFKAISPTVGGLITAVGTAATTFTSEVTANGASITATTFLAAIAAVIPVLQAELAGSPNSTTVLIYIAALDSAIAAGLAATKITAVDPAQLQPATPA